MRKLLFALIVLITLTTYQETTSIANQRSTPLGCVKWNFETNGGAISSVTIGLQGEVHIACEDGNIYTLDTDGELMWTYDANTPLLSLSSFGGDGSLYVGGDNGVLFAIDANGNLRWTYTTQGRIYASPAISDNGSVYVASMDGTLYALGPDGSELWSVTLKGVGGNPSGSILASPRIGNNETIYLGGLYDPNLYAVNAGDGSMKWACTFENLIDPCEEGGWPVTSPAIGPDGTIYQTLLHDSHLYAVDANNGNILWATNLADPCSGWFEPDYSENYPLPDGWSEPAIGPDGTIYASLDDPYLRALSPDGEILWATKLGVVGAFLLTIDNNGFIYAVSDDGDLSVVNPEGIEIAHYETNGWPGYPVIAGPNTIIVSDSRDYSVMMPDARNKVVAISTDNCSDKTLVLHWLEDIDGSGSVDWLDIELMANNWLECTTFAFDVYQPSTCDFADGRAYLTGDINKNMSVDFADWALLATRWLDSSKQ